MWIIGTKDSLGFLDKNSKLFQGILQKIPEQILFFKKFKNLHYNHTFVVYFLRDEHLPCITSCFCITILFFIYNNSFSIKLLNYQLNYLLLMPSVTRKTREYCAMFQSVVDVTIIFIFLII